VETDQLTVEPGGQQQQLAATTAVPFPNFVPFDKVGARYRYSFSVGFS
jgi:hypothetical protein